MSFVIIYYKKTFNQFKAKHQHEIIKSSEVPDSPKLYEAKFQQVADILNTLRSNSDEQNTAMLNHRPSIPPSAYCIFFNMEAITMAKNEIRHKLGILAPEARGCKRKPGNTPGTHVQEHGVPTAASVGISARLQHGVRTRVGATFRDNSSFYRLFTMSNNSIFVVQYTRKEGDQFAVKNKPQILFDRELDNVHDFCDYRDTEVTRILRLLANNSNDENEILLNSKQAPVRGGLLCGTLFVMESIMSARTFKVDQLAELKKKPPPSQLHSQT